MLKLSSLLVEADEDHVDPEMVYPFYIKVRNRIGWDDKKLAELREKYGFNPKYYDSIRTWIYSIHPEYLDNFYEELLKMNGSELEEIKNVSKVDAKMLTRLVVDKFTKDPNKVWELVEKYFGKDFGGDFEASFNLLPPEKIYSFYQDIKKLKENNMIKLTNIVQEFASAGYPDKNKILALQDRVERAINQSGRQGEAKFQMKRQLGKIIMKRKDSPEKLYDDLVWFAQLNNLGGNLREAPQDYQNYLDNPDFQKDYGNEQQIQKITATIKDRIAKKKWQEYSDGSYTMKIGDLYVKYFPEGSSGLKRAELLLGYKPEAGYSPESKILYLYGKVDDNEIRHELTHYIDAKVIGGKQVAAQSKERNAQLSNTQGRERYELYYNTPEEFNAHWFEYIMPVVNQLFDDGNVPSLDQFTQFVKTNKDVDNFYDHLNDQNKERFNKRLGVYYQAMQQGRPEVDNGKIETPGFIGKLKSLFQKRAA